MTSAGHEAGEELRDRPIGEVAGRLTQDVSTLIRQELELARLETLARLRSLVPGGVLVGTATIIALGAVGALVAAVVLALAVVLDAWAAALITAAMAALLAFGLAAAGWNRIKEAGMPVPAETIENMEEDVAWIRKRADSARR